MSALDDLFKALDHDADGALSRPDLHAAARRLGWHWPQAPLYALLDRLTLEGALDRAAFAARMDEVTADPLGPYGRVQAGLALPPPTPTAAGRAEEEEDPGQLPPLLRRVAGDEPAADFAALLAELGEPAEIDPATAALLVIDPQRSFTAGSWMRSVGRHGGEGRREVAPIDLAFARCARLLARGPAGAARAFTRCPFPPDSYAWDERVARALDPAQPYFIKPGNSALWPPHNGYARWVADLLQRGRTTLVMGGCTLNSCVRVSAVETRQRFEAGGLRLVVDLSLCGARAGNYARSDEFGGRSSVEAAVREMSAAGCRVVPRVRWA